MKRLYSTVLVALLLFASQFAFAQTPILNSYPSARATIFLDFDGQTVSGTSWNYSSASIVCGPSNLNNAQINEVYNRIAEDYRPFNINVTTDSTVYWAAPARQRMRCILTISSAWYGVAGGVGYIGSFTWGDNTPCFVFTALHNYNVKNISESASHEIGHTLGLAHQSSYDGNCTKLSDYNGGYGSGEIGWAPIMGVGYYENFTLWHNGHNSNSCTAIQDDLGIITGSSNGFGYRVDDHAGTFVGATVTDFVQDTFAINGVISKTDDQDVFKFNLANKGQFVLDGVPYNVGAGNSGSNLDMQIELIDGSQNVLGTYNPGNALNSIIDTALSAGTYYLRVDGKGNLYATEYGSLGSYSLQGHITPINALPLHKLELKGNTANGQHQLNWEIDADEKVTNQVIEVSSNGGSFAPLTQTNAATRTYTYTPSGSATLQYRIKVTFDNGREYYSNVIALRNSSFSKPQLFTNVLYTNSLIVSSPGVYQYTITDYAGKMVSKGQIVQGSSSITVPNISKGVYVIRFDNGQQQYTEKFTNQ